MTSTLREEAAPAASATLPDIAPSASTSGQHDRVAVLGVGISAVDMDTAIALSDRLLRSEKRGYVCVTGVHGVMEAQSDTVLRETLNRSYMTVPDGMPTVWIGRLEGHSNMRRVYGPDYMLKLCQSSVERRYRHFLFGGKEGVADRLSEVLKTRFPGLNVVGTYTPPFRKMTGEESDELAALVARTKPDIFWVGLSTPKQERFMAEYVGKLDVKLMVGVGAAFDIHTGGIKDAPDWIKNSGLQWLHRLLQEPRRLFRRYLFNNPRFVWKIGLHYLTASGRNP